MQCLVPSKRLLKSLVAASYSVTLVHFVVFMFRPSSLAFHVLAKESNLEEGEYFSSMFSLRMVDGDQNL